MVVSTSHALFWGLLVFAATTAVNAQKSEFLAQLFNSDYDEQTRPYYNLSQPVVVDCQYRINLLFDVDSKNENYKIDLFVREWWTDPRLSFPADRWAVFIEDGSIRIPATVRAWKPDTFFYNALSCSTTDQMMSIEPSGRIFWSRHQTCMFRAKFDLVSFPFDSQAFDFKRMSFSYPKTDLVVRAKPDACYSPDPMRHFDSSLWELKGTACADGTVHFRDFQPEYSQTAGILFVKRRVENYVVKLILPMFILTFLSTLTYFIDIGSPPARVGFSITLVLSIVTFNLVVSQDLPKINYPTMLDWYVWKSFLFVIFAVAEYAAAHNIIATKKLPAIYGHLMDDFCQFTMGPMWLMGNTVYWPTMNQAGNICVGILMVLYFLANVYRVRWNYVNEQRGLVLFTQHMQPCFNWCHAKICGPPKPPAPAAVPLDDIKTTTPPAPAAPAAAQAPAPVSVPAASAPKP